MKAFRGFRLGAPINQAFLRCGGLIHHSANVESDFITPQYALVYLVRGRGEYIDGKGQSYQLSPNSVYQRFPGVSHRVRLEGGAARCYVAVPAEFLTMARDTGFPLVTQPVFTLEGQSSHPPVSWDEFVELARLIQESPQDRLMDVLIDMQHLILKIHRLANTLPDGKSSFIIEAKRLLRESSSRRQSIGRVIAPLGMKYNTFRKYFFQATGESPGEYRLNARLERGAELLAHTGHSIEEIAGLLGYRDSFAFSAQFKRKTGQCPRDFRKTMGKI